MSNDRSAVAFERLDEAADEDRRPGAALACDLAEIASALAQIEVLVTAGANENPETSAAVERIADIAFVLHEREVEPSLCDALDAAMRDISEANARNRTNVQRAHEAAELLRALVQRIEAMMAAQAQEHASRSVADAELECADEFPAPARLFDVEAADDGAFAQTVAALAESLPERSDVAPAQFLDVVANSGAALEAPMPADDKSVQETSPSAGVHAAETISGVGGREPHESVTTVSVVVPSPDPVTVASLASSADAEAVPADDMNQSIDPDEDPGDLFEPTPDMHSAADAPSPVAAIQETASPASLAPQAPRDAASAPSHAASRPAANDPLAPIRALSEEELIALFS